jgi:hypothetical protein
MTHTSIFWRTAGGFLVALGLAAALPSIEAAAPERFVATAVSIATPGPTGAGTVEMVVERYSTDEERDQLLKALLEKGPEKLLDTLQRMTRVGYIRTPNSIGYDLKYARKMPLDEGGEQITLATDRYITFWEAANRPRTIDYPFTLIEMRIGPDGEGEGKMSLFTKIMYDKKKNQIVLENYASQPVLLTKVRREPANTAAR